VTFDAGKNLNSSDVPVPFSGSQAADRQRQLSISERKLPASVRGWMHESLAVVTKFLLRY